MSAPGPGPRLPSALVSSAPGHLAPREPRRPLPDPDLRPHAPASAGPIPSAGDTHPHPGARGPGTREKMPESDQKEAVGQLRRPERVAVPRLTVPHGASLPCSIPRRPMRGPGPGVRGRETASPPVAAWSVTLSRSVCVCACVCHIRCGFTRRLWRPRSSRGAVTSTCPPGLGRGGSAVSTKTVFW